MTDWKKADTYRGFEIQINQRNFEFFIDGDGYAGERHVMSFKAAKEAIDAHYTEEGKKEIKTVTMRVDVLDEDGEPLTITGLHRGTDQGKVASNSRTSYQGTAYPVVDWVRNDLRNLKEMRAAITIITERMHKVGVEIGSSWNSGIPAEHYARRIAVLTERLSKAAQLAQKGPEAVLKDEPVDD